jgi:hypothetical protein
MDRRALLACGSVLMTHALFAETLGAFLSDARAAEGPPVLLSAEEMATLTVLVDVILPATDSPAASAARTHVFVDCAAHACATPEQQATLRAGLRDLEAASRARYRRGFAEISAARQAALLTTRAEVDMALTYDQSFFKILKDYTLVGYFHSEIGATQALAYEQIPGGYWGDLPLAPGQKAWAI